ADQQNQRYSYFADQKSGAETAMGTIGQRAFAAFLKLFVNVGARRIESGQKTRGDSTDCRNRQGKQNCMRIQGDFIKPWDEPRDRWRHVYAYQAYAHIRKPDREARTDQRQRGAFQQQQPYKI